MKILKAIYRYFPVLTFSIIISACSAGRSVSLYQPYLSSTTASSKSTDLKVKIPKGWYSAIDNEKNILDIWLIKDDHTAVLNFILLNIDKMAIEDKGGKELNASMMYSKEIKSAFSRRITKKDYDDQNYDIDTDDFFEIGSNVFGTYNYKTDDGKLIRVILFKYQNRIYECSAVPVSKTGLNDKWYEELFLIQDAVLSSIE